VQDQELPAAMANLGLSELRLETGEKVKVSTWYSASIPLENRDAAFDWLHANGHGDIVKHNVSVDFKKGEEESAAAAVKQLEDIGLTAKDETKVAPQTLKAFVREELEAGRELPETFKVLVGQRAVIKK